LKIRYTAEAHQDLLDALAHGMRNDPAATTRLADRLFLVIGRLAAGEFEGPEAVMTTGEIVRSWPVRPFRIYYERTGDELLVIRIYHQARPPIAR
jgi:plasmid stabilization system protein ParE